MWDYTKYQCRRQTRPCFNEGWIQLKYKWSFSIEYGHGLKEIEC